MSFKFIALQIPQAIFAQYYSSPKRKGITDEGFLDKINGPFICLTAVISWYSLRC